MRCLQKAEPGEHEGTGGAKGILVKLCYTYVYILTVYHCYYHCYYLYIYLYH